ncbi:MAG TPA: DUF503 domain-containing protein [Magnetospirillaceae bacterium]|nr:DUF503 domain-containing protein [Magnetospirillaceae bacterium]
MVVSMIQFILELPETTTLKEKRRMVLSVKDKLRCRFRISCAEVDLQDSHQWAQIGCALVSNSREHGESVLQKALALTETLCRVRDVQVHSEIFE